MRRILASLLLGLISLGIGLPFVEAQQTWLPACCRRDGAHHCISALHGPDGFRTAASSCPFHRVSAVSANLAGLPVPRQALNIRPPQRPTTVAEFMGAARPTPADAFKRGPPLA